MKSKTIHFVPMNQTVFLTYDDYMDKITDIVGHFFTNKTDLFVTQLKSSMQNIFVVDNLLEGTKQ